jgi:hypothetical protein
MIVAADTNSMTGAMKALDPIALSPLNLPWRGDSCDTRPGSAWDGFNTFPAAEFAACKIPGTKLIIYEEGRASSSWRLIRGGSQRSSQLSRRCSVYWQKIHDLHRGIDTLGSIPRLEPLWVVTRSCWRQQGARR